MSDAISLDERRWAKDNDTRAHSVAATLRVAIGQLERGEITADHVIICFGSENQKDGSITTDWLQSGKFLGFAQLGVLERIKMAIISSAETT